MDKLSNKKFESYDYTSRYTTVPYYFDSTKNREVYGIGTQLDKNTAWVAHKVIQSDTLDALALTYYNNPTYWWVIALFNNILDPFVPLYKKFKIIKIPSISSIEFKDPRV